MKSNAYGSASDVLVLLIEHIDALMMQAGAQHIPRTSSLTAAQAVMRKWSNEHLRAFHFAATSESFVTKKQIAHAAKANLDSLHGFFRKLKAKRDRLTGAMKGGSRIPIIDASGQCVDMHLFRDGAECVHSSSGVNELGQKVLGGIRIMLATKRVPFSQAMDASMVNKPVVNVTKDNDAGLDMAIESGSRRDVTQREKTRVEYERARESRVMGPQLQLLKTGTDAE